ncbi:MAG: hypothetical protein LUQ07_08280, partial [Methanospirillum sp.]|nr:hypothetical protein [Methanospirillum sp.]
MAEESGTFRNKSERGYRPDEEYLSNNIILCTKSGKSADIEQGSCDHSASDHIRDLKLPATSDQGSESEGYTERVHQSGQLNSSGKVRNNSAEGQDFPLQGVHSASLFSVNE